MSIITSGSSTGSVIASTGVIGLDPYEVVILNHSTISTGGCTPNVKRRVPYGLNTNLLLHCNGTDGSTTFTDSFGKHTIGVGGSAQIDTAQSKFGGASLLLNGTTDYIYVPTSRYLNLGRLWRIDFFVRFASVAGIQKLLSTRGPNGTGWEISLNGAKINMEGFGDNNSGGAHAGTTTITTGQWYWVCIYTAAGVTTLYVDGNNENELNNSFNWSAGGHDLYIGKPESFNEPVNGWMDEIRILTDSDADASITTPVAEFGTNYPDEYEMVDCGEWSRTDTGFAASTGTTSTKFKNLTGSTDYFVCLVVS